MNINFGVPDIDAYSFSEMAEKASKENGAFFAIKLLICLNMLIIFLTLSSWMLLINEIGF